MLKFIIFLCSVSMAFGQVEIQNKNGVATVQKVIEVPGKSAADIYKSAIRWISIAFNNPEAVTTSTIENELITGQGSGELSMAGFNSYKYRLQIDVKDGKARITTENFTILTNIGTYD